MGILSVITSVLGADLSLHNPSNAGRKKVYQSAEIQEQQLKKAEGKRKKRNSKQLQNQSRCERNNKCK